MRLMDRLRQMMIGRYGNDQLNITLIVIYFITFFLTTLTGWVIFVLIGEVGFILYVFRSFSRNIPKRYAENQKFLSITLPIRRLFNRSLQQTQDKNHKYYTCKQCGQRIRVPKGKGKIAITCPKCKVEFIKKT